MASTPTDKLNTELEAKQTPQAARARKTGRATGTPVKIPAKNKAGAKKLRGPAKPQDKRDSKLSAQNLQEQLEALLLTSGEPLSLRRFNEVLNPLGIDSQQIQLSLQQLQQKYKTGVLRLVKSASGYVFHITEEYSEIVNLFKQDKPSRYSRALMETLAIIAYKQPVTKAEIEELRGVTLSTGIMRSLQEHEWIKILGHKDVPGKPAIWGTTKVFLDSFKLSSLKDLPELSQAAEQAEQGEPAEQAQAEQADEPQDNQADAMNEELTESKQPAQQAKPQPTIDAKQDASTAS